MRSSFLLRGYLWALFSTVQWQAVFSAGAQYCQNSQPDFCMTVSSRENATTRGRDVYLSISATPSGTGGWLSVGIGEKMAGALMFILYSDVDRERLAVSARTATGHVMPTVVTENPPDIEVTKATIVPETGQSLVEIVCYSCNEWPSLDPNSISQPWTFAENRGQVFRSLDVNASLHFHQIHGHLAVDMPSTLLTAEEPIPSIDSQKQSFGAWAVTHGKEKSKSWPTAVQLHGLIMTICFMGIFTFGTLMIRWPHAQSFRLHWVAQLIASLLAIGSAAYMLSRARHLGPHKIIGLIATSLLLLQGWFGYKHHVVFVQVRKQSLFTTLHLWLGRSVLCLGIFNVGTGMYFAGWSALALAVWLVIVVAELVGYLYVTYRHRRRRHQENKNMKGTDQEMIGDDNNNDNEEGSEGVPLMERVA